jgi:hypothetical protein
MTTQPPNNFADLIRTVSNADHGYVIRTPVTSAPVDALDSNSRIIWNSALLAIALNDPYTPRRPTQSDTITCHYTLDAYLINSNKNFPTLFDALERGNTIVSNRGRS